MSERLTIQDAITEVEKRVGKNATDIGRVAVNRYPNGDLRVELGSGAYRIGWEIYVAPVDGTPLFERQDVQTGTLKLTTTPANPLVTKAIPSNGNGTPPPRPRTYHYGERAADLNNLLDAVAEYRDRTGKSEAQIALELGRGKATISEWRHKQKEGKHVTYTTLANLQQHAAVLGVPVESLYA